MCISIAISDDTAAEPDEYFMINWIVLDASNVIITPAVTNVTIESKYTLYMYMYTYMYMYMYTYMYMYMYVT